MLLQLYGGFGVQTSIGKQLKQILDIETSVRIGFLAHVRLLRLLLTQRCFAELLWFAGALMCLLYWLPGLQPGCRNDVCMQAQSGSLVHNTWWLMRLW